jgi:ceramide glucosyltransferase
MAGCASERLAGTIAAPVLISLLHVLRWVSAAATAASTVYCLITAFAGVSFRRRRWNGPPRETSLPMVSILKPLKGADPDMYEALRSHCLQHYPDYEMLFGITGSDDLAAGLVEKLIREFPDKKIRQVLCGKRLGANGKVSSLIQLAQVASAEYWLVNDSDIRVEPDYLRTVIGELQQPEVGLVTCLYRGIPGRSLGSRFEALGISTDFMPGVLAADLIEGGIHFGLGSTLAFRKTDLNAIGGFGAIVDYLADDYELGNRIAQLGRKIRLSPAVVETNLPAYDCAGFWAHQLRWARTIRASRPGGYLGLLLTFTLPWAFATLALSGGKLWAWGLAASAIAARFLLAVWTSRAVLDEKRGAPMLLLPIRDLLAVAVWIAGWFGNSVWWRGERFLLRDGRLIPD